MRIIRLQAENVKRLRSVAVRPDGSPLVTIGGKNAQGKTSCLDAIVYALGGRGTHAQQVVRRGEKGAQVILELDDLVIERTWDRTGATKLEVRDRGGVKLRSPQEVLNKLYSRISFDPVAFLSMEPRQQADLLKKVAGLDFTDLDAERDRVYAERTAAHRALNQAEAELRAAPAIPDGVPEEEVPVRDLLARQADALKTRSANDAKRLEARRAREHVTGDGAQVVARQRTHIADLERQLAKARETLATLEDQLTLASDRAEALEEEVAGLVDPDLPAVEAEIAKAEDTNRQVRLRKKRDEIAVRVRAAGRHHAALDQRVKDIDEKKLQLISAAKMPVPALGFSDDGLVLLNGLPLEQASQAEQLRLSVAMGLALNPELRVLLVRTGSLLDETSMRLLEELAEAHDAQVWVEVAFRHGGPAEEAGCAVIIEDGTARGPAVEAAVADFAGEEASG
jgi:DNA repair exonuclease SbcCD ATPase subunit